MVEKGTWKKVRGENEEKEGGEGGKKKKRKKCIKEYADDLFAYIVTVMTP